jgi:hypothetical protein
MLANFFGKSNPGNYVIILFLFSAYFLGAFFLGFSPTNDLLWLTSVFVLYLILFFFFNFILAKNKLTLYNSYGFLFFVMLFGIFPFTLFDREVLIFNVVLLIMLRRIYSLRTSKSVIKKMFDSGFWLAILFILEPFSLVYVLLIYVSIAIFQKLNLRAFFIPIVGFLVPLICYFTYVFWMNTTDDFLQLFAWYTDYDFSFYTTEKVMIPLITLGILALVSILFKTPKVLLVSGNYRRFWTLTILNLLVAIAFIAFTKDRNGAELMAAFFPLAIIYTNAMEEIPKRFIQDVMLALFLVGSIVMITI